jgi:hypothetical protein
MMKRLLLSLLLTLFASWAVGQEKGRPVGGKLGAVKRAGCPENRDKLYPRRDTLQRFADILKNSIPEFEEHTGLKFEVRDGETQSFGVYDLTDPSNAGSTAAGTCTELIDNHVYHVVPGLNDYSFSHIIILEGGNMKVFRSINCRDRGDKLEDVIAYLNAKLIDGKSKHEVLGRVREYRKYGKYVRMDNFSGLRCESIAN